MFFFSEAEAVAEAEADGENCKSNIGQILGMLHLQLGDVLCACLIAIPNRLPPITFV